MKVGDNVIIRTDNLKRQGVNKGDIGNIHYITPCNGIYYICVGSIMTCSSDIKDFELCTDGGDYIDYFAALEKGTRLNDWDDLIKIEEKYGEKDSIFNQMSEEQYDAIFDNEPDSTTSSLRFNENKIQTREIDPNFILGLGQVLTKSREKYEHFNWCKPTKLSTPMESMERHLLAFKAGEDIDPDDGLHHLLKAAVNIMFQYYHITNNPEYSDDRFFKKDKK